jgi:hypothetical protein
MKTQILLFIITIFILNICTHQSLFANQPVVMTDLPLVSCLDKIDSNNVQPDFKNWYHVNISDWDTQKYWLEARKAVCGFYVAWWDVTRIQLASIIPIYMPKIVTPVWLQNIYVWQDYVYPERIGYTLWGWNTNIFLNKRSFSWFQFGGFGWRTVSEGQIVYLKSLEEPFRSAPMLQMYYYLGQPLLVARNNTGIITDVFFQNRPGIVDPMLRAKRFLWEKWYHP